MNMMKISRSSLVFACAAGLGLAGCSQEVGAANADSTTYDVALEDAPCSVVTTQMVATAFELPASAIEQSNVMSSTCAYEMKRDGEKLKVEVSVDAYESAEDAANQFLRATRSMSSEEVSAAMNSIQGEAERNLDTAAQKDASESIGAGMKQSGGIQFEDVNGVADQARFAVSDGTLQLQEGNLRIKLRAYYGPAMQIPDSYEPGSMQKVVKAWMQDTMEERKAQSVKLANIALDAL
jgi:hypothetical protein